ncbi:MAG TPA: hypothetical protein VFB43_18580 [Terracidiphilus sp.]|nr:hypothetical protein [Terracidiphilus sp.]
MKTSLSSLTFPTKLTIAGLVACAVAIWTQWLSGDPAYPKFPPGPVFFIAVAAIVAFAARWWWTPLIGSLIALLVTSGWFARLPRHVQLLTHPGSIGHFAPGIFLGTLGLIISLLLTDAAGLWPRPELPEQKPWNGRLKDSAAFLRRHFRPDGRSGHC